MNIGQAIDGLHQDNSGVYVSEYTGCPSLTMKVRATGIYITDEEGKIVPLNNISILREWKKVIQSVNFIEAINSGKRIRSERWDYPETIAETLRIIHNNTEYGSTNFKDIINSKWYIEEE